MTRPHDVGQLTTAELEVARRQLRANLGLITPGSPAHAPILARMRAIDAELAGRPLTGSPARASVTTARYFPAPLRPAGRDPGTHEPRPARDMTPNGTRADAATGMTTAPAADVRRPACPLPPGAHALPQGAAGTAPLPGAWLT